MNSYKVNGYDNNIGYNACWIDARPLCSRPSVKNLIGKGSFASTSVPRYQQVPPGGQKLPCRPEPATRLVPCGDQRQRKGEAVGGEQVFSRCATPPPSP
jgi:hypothetical protein